MERQRIQLGELLVQHGLITKDVLSEALAAQSKHKMKLGDYLVREGLVSEEDIVNLVSEQLRIPRYSPTKHSYDTDIARLIDAQESKENGVIPLNRKNRLLTVATLDPWDCDLIDTLEITTGLEVAPVMCTRHELQALHNAIFGGEWEEKIETFENVGEIDAEEAEDKNNIAINLTDSEVVDEAPIIRVVNSILYRAVREKASDIHISPEKEYIQLRIRVDGKLRELPAPPRNIFGHIISRIKIMSGMDISSSLIPQDGRFTIHMENRDINVRASALPTIYGENLVLRLLDHSAGSISLDQLGLCAEDQDKIERVIKLPYGLIISSGPTGSGKSTSLYSILRKTNKPDVNIITLEDPVEYRINGIRQVQLNVKAGMTFASGLRSILRQDPDTVLVGEIRDGETASIATQAALTGHLVLSTVHTNDASGVPTRFVDMGVEPFLAASVLQVCIGQRLIRRLCTHCAQPHTPTEKEMEFWKLPIPENANFKSAVGCSHCHNSGYSGRVAVFEVLEIDDSIRHLILKEATSQEIANHAVENLNHRLMRVDAFEKAAQGLTTLSEAMSIVLG